MGKEGKVKKILVAKLNEKVDEPGKSDEALQAEKNKLQSVIDSLEYGLTIQDKDYDIIYQNEITRGYFGDHVGEKCYRVYGDGKKACEGCPMKKALKDGKSHTAGRRRIEPSGEVTYWENTASPIRDAEGKIISCLEITRDITERKKAEKALQKGEKNYKLLFESTLDGMFVLDAETMKVVLANQAAADIYGLNSAEEAIGVNLLDFVPPEEREQVLRIIAKDMFENDLRQVNEFRTITKDGREIWISAVGTRTEYQGKIAGLVSFSDITERKRAEEKLRESEARYRAVVEGTHDMIQSVGLDGRIIFVNKSWLDTLGYTEAELSSLNLFDIIHSGSQAHCQKMFAEVISGKSIHGIEAAFLTKDGRKILVEGNAAPRYIGNRVMASQGVFRDVTERKQAEDALKESEEKYKTLVEATSDIIWETDRKGRFTFVSPRIKDVLGYEVDEVVGKKRTLDFIPKGEARKWLKRFKEVSAKREPFFGFEIPHLHKNGNQLIFETSGIPLFDSAGEYKGYVGINKDVTERRQMQEQLVITDRLASVGELAAGIAHELNNPLTGVIGFSQLLLDKEMPDDIRQDIEVVYGEAQRTSQVVKNLLTFARKHTAVKQMLNINDVIEKVLELRAYEQRVENITVKGRLASDLPEVMADYFQLQQVFLNIITNAEHFMKEAHNKGTLTVTTEQVGNKVRASFADDGPGIADENLGHLFDPFFTTKEVGSGTGLGLSICHGIIAEHGGRIYVKSELGKGSTFIVELPIGAAKKKGGAA